MKKAARWKSFLRRRYAVVVLLLILIGAAWYGGAFESFRNPEQVHALLTAWGAWAYVLYLVSFVLLMPFGIPAFFWVLPAGILWPFWIAYPLSLVAVVGGSSVGFLFARYIARDWVASRVPGRVRRFDAHFSARGLRSVIIFRLVFQLGAPTHWLLGLSKVGYPTFVLGTLLGAMPVVALVAWFGRDAFMWVETHAVLATAILAAIIAAFFVVRLVLRARRT